MTAHAKRVEIAALVTPWTVVIVSALWAIWHFFTSPGSTPENLVFPDPAKPWEFLFLFSMYGVPTAYLSLAVFLPLYLLARRVNAASYPVVIGLGVLTCLPAACFYGRLDSFVRTLFFLMPYGVVAAVCFLWIVRRGANGDGAKRGEPNSRPPSQPPSSSRLRSPDSPRTSSRAGYGDFICCVHRAMNLLLVLSALGAGVAWSWEPPRIERPGRDSIVLPDEGMTFRRISPRMYGTNVPDFFLLETEVSNAMFARYLKATTRTKGDQELAREGLR